MSRQQTRKSAGFTLIEVIVSLSAFTIIMLAVVAIFGSAFVSYRETRSLQHNLESAQFAMNTMAKELRTSSVLSSSGAGSNIDIRFYDYSQNKCIRYLVMTNRLNKYSAVVAGSDPNARRGNCTVSAFGGVSAQVLVEDVVESSASSVPSDDSPRTVGRVTVRLRIGTTVNNQTIQSSVSLRDFNFIDI